VASATALGVSGLILAPTAYTGLVASAGFTVLDLAKLFTTWTAVRMVMTGRFGGSAIGTPMSGRRCPPGCSASGSAYEMTAS
jgi:hypothetical protein